MKFDDNGIQTPVEETDMERVLTPADLGNHIDYQAMQPELREGDWVSADGFGEGEIIRLLAPETGVALVRMDSFSKLVQPDDDGEVFIALNLLSKVEPEVVQSDPLIEAIITALQPGGELVDLHPFQIGYNMRPFAEGLAKLCRRIVDETEHETGHQCGLIWKGVGLSDCDECSTQPKKTLR